jgi:hypothetical protein
LWETSRAPLTGEVPQEKEAQPSWAKQAVQTIFDNYDASLPFLDEAAREQKIKSHRFSAGVAKAQGDLYQKNLDAALQKFLSLSDNPLLNSVGLPVATYEELMEIKRSGGLICPDPSDGKELLDYMQDLALKITERQEGIEYAQAAVETLLALPAEPLASPSEEERKQSRLWDTAREFLENLAPFLVEIYTTESDATFHTPTPSQPVS